MSPASRQNGSNGHGHEPHAVLAAAARREKEHQESVERLWLAVIERAVDDLEQLEELGKRGRDDLRRSEKTRLAEIEKQPPQPFLEGPWFEVICDGLGLEPDRVWKLLDLERFGVEKPAEGTGR